MSVDGLTAEHDSAGFTVSAAVGETLLGVVAESVTVTVTVPLAVALLSVAVGLSVPNGVLPIIHA